jgi:lipopolysaccharide biosynthesis regulator YciM
MDAIVSLEKANQASDEQTRERYIEHLQKQPSLLAASRWLAGADLGDETTRAPVQKALEQASRPLARYRCAACGFEAKEHFWHCPGCQAWDSYPPRRVEEL